MGWLAELFETNRIIVLSVYGQVFFVMGLAVALQQRRRSQLSLARSLGLDPNQFPAYILQAHLAMSRGDGRLNSRLSSVLSSSYGSPGCTPRMSRSPAM